MTVPVLPPDVPIVGPSKVQPQWWRWFRDVNDAIDANSQAVIDAQATRVADVALTAGSNVVAHGLGTTPTSWWAARPRGAFPTLGGLYPNITPPRGWATFINGSGTSFNHTLSFTPAEGSHLVAVLGIESGSAVISSISQTGVTWSKLLGPISAYDRSEMWIGVVGSGASTSMTVTYGSSYFYPSVVLIELPEIASATPTASEVVGLTTTDYYYDSDEQFTTPPVPNAGDIVVAAVVATSLDGMPVLGNWDPRGGIKTSVGSAGCVAMWTRVAQEAEHQNIRCLPTTTIRERTMYQVCFPSSLVQAGGSIPHGLREVAIDDTNVTIDSIGAVTVDLYFK